MSHPVGSNPLTLLDRLIVQAENVTDNKEDPEAKEDSKEQEANSPRNQQNQSTRAASASRHAAHGLLMANAMGRQSPPTDVDTRELDADDHLNHLLARFDSNAGIEPEMGVYLNRDLADEVKREAVMTGLKEFQSAKEKADYLVNSQKMQGVATLGVSSR